MNCVPMVRDGRSMPLQRLAPLTNAPRVIRLHFVRDEVLTA